jgi:hypothetical protein
MSLASKLSVSELTFVAQKEANAEFEKVVNALEVDRGVYEKEFSARLDTMKEKFILTYTLMVEGSNHKFGLQSSENSRNVEALRVQAAYNDELTQKIRLLSTRIDMLEEEFDIPRPPGLDDELSKVSLSNA